MVGRFVDGIRYSGRSQVSLRECCAGARGAGGARVRAELQGARDAQWMQPEGREMVLHGAEAQRLAAGSCAVARGGDGRRVGQEQNREAGQEQAGGRSSRKRVGPLLGRRSKQRLRGGAHSPLWRFEYVDAVRVTESWIYTQSVMWSDCRQLWLAVGNQGAWPRAGGPHQYPPLQVRLPADVQEFRYALHKTQQRTGQQNGLSAPNSAAQGVKQVV